MARKANIAMHHGSIDPPSKFSKKDLIRLLLKFERQEKTYKEIKKELLALAHKALHEEYGTALQTFDAMLIEHLVMKDIVMEAAGIDINEWNKRYLEKERKRKSEKK